MRVSARRALAGATTLLALTGVLASVPAAASLTDDRVVSSNPVNYTPNVNQGAVTSIARVGDTMVAVGGFTTVTDLHGTTFNRTNIFAFDANTGEVSKSFVPIVNGKVNRVVSAGDGTSVYIGGAFSQVNGQNASHVTRLDVSKGGAVNGFKAAATNGVVFDMVLNNGRLYIGGKFMKVGGKSRTLLAALDPTSGADTGAVDATFDTVFNGGTLAVKAFDVSPDGARLVAVGNFRNVDGQSRPQVVMLDTDTDRSVATVDSWATQGYTRPCAANAFDTYMRDVSMSTDGRYFAIATTGAFDGGVNNNSLCDTITRWELGATGGDQQPTWVNYSGGDTFYAVSAIGKIVYIGGHQRWVNNPYAGDKPGAGAVDREGIAVFDARNGMPLSWNPGRARGVGLREFLPIDDGLWVAHDTNRLGREQRKRVAFLPLTGGQPLPAERTGALPGDVYTAGRLPDTSSSAGDAVTRHPMSAAGTTGAPAAVGGGDEPWGQARGAFMVDGKVYYGQSDGTFHARTYDGTTFGPDVQIDLNPAKKFGDNLADHTFMADLPNVTGMFYDRSNARLYYALAGQSRLYYRYFLPESEIVGAARMTGPTAPAGADWSAVSGMFLTGGDLYFGRSDGTLGKVAWSSGAPSGAVQTVATTGHDWRARSTFLYAP